MTMETTEKPQVIPCAGLFGANGCRQPKCYMCARWWQFDETRHTAKTSVWSCHTAKDIDECATMYIEGKDSGVKEPPMLASHIKRMETLNLQKMYENARQAYRRAHGKEARALMWERVERLRTLLYGMGTKPKTEPSEEDLKTAEQLRQERRAAQVAKAKEAVRTECRLLPEEQAFIFCYYPTEGSEYIVTHLQDITAEYVRRFAWAHGLKHPTANKKSRKSGDGYVLTEADRRYIREFYPTHGWAFIHKYLPHVKRPTLTAFCAKEGVKMQRKAKGAAIVTGRVNNINNVNKEAV